MKPVLQLLSLVALGLTITPPLLFFTGTLQLAAVQKLLLAGAALWFLSAPFWMEHRRNG